MIIKNKEKYNLNNLSIDIIDEYPYLFGIISDVSGGWSREIYKTKKKLSESDIILEIFSWLEEETEER